MKKKKYKIEKYKNKDNKKIYNKILNQYNYQKSFYDRLAAQNDYKDIKSFYKNTYETLSENDLLINTIAVFQQNLNYMTDNTSFIHNSLKNI